MMSTQCSKHVEEYNKLVMKQEFVHYVGRLQRLLLIHVTAQVTLLGNIACKPPPDISEVTYQSRL